MLSDFEVDGKIITKVASGTTQDVDAAVAAARAAFKSSWGLKVSGYDRGRMLSKLADIIEANADELAALEALNAGQLHSYHPCASSRHLTPRFLRKTVEGCEGQGTRQHVTKYSILLRLGR